MKSKTLYILRHAKAEQPEGVQDKDRPLSPEGRSNALDLADRMREKKYAPALVLCSPALRTRQTCALVNSGSFAAPVIYDEKIYMASAGDLYECLKAAGDRYETIMLVGHNPGVHGLARLLAGSGEPALLARLAAGYPPGSLAVLACGSQSWGELMPGACRLSDFP